MSGTAPSDPLPEPPGGGRLDPALPFTPLALAILTVSDSRTPSDDKSGDLLAERAEQAGHRIADRALVPDEAAAITAQLASWLGAETAQVILTTGGTGVTSRDVTPEAVEALLEKRLEGFGEAFRHLSHEKIGTSALQSRAIGGVAQGKLLFALPGSPSACRDAWDGILRWQLDSRHRPCNLAEMLPRLS